MTATAPFVGIMTNGPSNGGGALGWQLVVPELALALVMTYGKQVAVAKLRPQLEQHLNYLLACADVQVRGKYPSFTDRLYKEHGVNKEDLEITEEDLALIAEHTVDYVGFSYYMSSAVDITTEEADEVQGNLLGGVRNPFLDNGKSCHYFCFSMVGCNK